MALSMLHADYDTKWHSVPSKSDARKKKQQQKTDTPVKANGKADTAKTVFAALDAWAPPENTVDHVNDVGGVDDNEASDDRSQPAVSTSQINGTKATPKKQKAPKKPKVTITQVSEQLGSDKLEEVSASLRKKYATDEVSQLETLADYVITSFKDCDLAFNKILQEQTLEQASEIPLSLVTAEFSAQLFSLFEERSLPALSSFTKTLIGAVLEGLPESLNGKTPPPKPKVGALLVLSALLRAQPGALLLLSEDILTGGQAYTSPGRLPVLLWALSQAARGDPAVATAVWVRALLPQVLGVTCGVSSGKSSDCIVARAANSSQAAILSFADDFFAPELSAIQATASSGFEITNGKKQTVMPVVPPAAVDALARSCYTDLQATKTVKGKLNGVYDTVRQIALSSTTAFSYTELVRLSLDTAALEPSDNVNLLVGAAADNVVAALAADDASFAAWEGRHRHQLKGSSRVLQYLSSTNLTALQPVLRDTAKRTQFAKTLKELQHRHRNHLSTGKGWQGACAKTADDSCVDLYSKIQVGGGSGLTFLLLTGAAVAAGFVAISTVDSVQQQARSLVGDEPVQTIVDLYEQVWKKVQPYADEFLSTVAPYIQQVSAYISPLVQKNGQS